ncbi:dual specificity protein phosphatase 1 [Pelomyxa schiedti]|nr:dual specificity protein phosphatase 1 [Pelomyxa schiedti]
MGDWWDVMLRDAFTPMHEVLEGLWLGSMDAARDYNKLKARGITHVLQVAAELKPLFPSWLKYHIIPIDDDIETDLERHFPAAFNFINEGRASGGVLVHCAAGISRSATVVVMYCMHSLHLNVEEAVTYVKSKRSVISPNVGFLAQLQMHYTDCLKPHHADQLQYKILYYSILPTRIP